MNVDYEFDPGPDYRGRMYAEFYVCRDATAGPGWYVLGRNPEYGGRLVKICARPNVSPRKHPHYSHRVRRGWHTMREAAAVAAWLNVSHQTA